MIKSISSLISSLLRLVIEGSKNEIKLDFETWETKLTQLIVERQDSSDNSDIFVVPHECGWNSTSTLLPISPKNKKLKDQLKLCLIIEKLS